MTMDVKEVVLPSGAFCKVRVLTGRDWLSARIQIDASKETGEPLDLIFLLSTQCVTIDDKPVTYVQMMDMDLRDVMKITSVVNGFINGPIK